MDSSVGGFRTFFRTAPESAVRAVTLPDAGVPTRGSLSRAMAIAREVERRAPHGETRRSFSPSGNVDLAHPAESRSRRYGAGLHLVALNMPETSARFRLPSHLRALAGRLQRRVRG